MARLDKLKPKTRRLAEELVKKCREQKIIIRITQTFRTNKEQDALYQVGRTRPGKIVTNAKGGSSLHNYGAAFDFCLIRNGKLDWSNIEAYGQVGRIGQALGLEWGGSWKKFKDIAHFQYAAGYSIGDFKRKKIDESKFK